MTNSNTNTNSINTVIITTNNSKVLEGGGVYWPSFQYLEEVDVLYIGWAGHIEYMTGYRNTTSIEIVLYHAYNTSANGMADEIAILPGEIIVETGSGCPHSFSTYRVWKGKDADLDKYSIQWCKDCGEPIKWFPIEYAIENHEACQQASEQAWRMHVSGNCNYSHKYDHVLYCPDCEEEIGRWDYEYAYSNPDGLDSAVEMASLEHREYCPVFYKKEWKRWHKETDTEETISPRQYLQMLRDENRWEELAVVPCPPDRYEEHWQYELDAFMGLEVD